MDVKSKDDPEPAPIPKAEQSKATRSALVATARELFAERGYASVGTEEIVRATGVTRGALYHHFRDKQDLFSAVYEQVESELTNEIGEAVMDPSNSAVSGPWEALGLGGELFLRACARPEIQRIALIDAPSVLGWERWREIGSRYGLGLIEEVLQAAIDAGEIEPRPVSTLAHMLLGAIDELALVIARAADRAAAQTEAQAMFTWLLESLRS